MPDERSLLAVHDDLVFHWRARGDAGFPHFHSVLKRSSVKACGSASETDYHAREGQAVGFSVGVLYPFLIQELDRREVDPVVAISGQYHHRL
jgi:hypothetical protein